ncbi:hypothetical protein DFP73DRAFT_558937 [Morchella snyderi]|nr:hypothetical protein DFP73DRAFT_558937 [Morchella snyderi]
MQQPHPLILCLCLPFQGMSRHLLLLHLIFYVSSVSSVHPLYHICILPPIHRTRKGKPNAYQLFLSPYLLSYQFKFLTLTKPP